MMQKEELYGSGPTEAASRVPADWVWVAETVPIGSLWQGVGLLNLPCVWEVRKLYYEPPVVAGTERDTGRQFSMPLGTFLRTCKRLQEPIAVGSLWASETVVCEVLRVDRGEVTYAPKDQAGCIFTTADESDFRRKWTQIDPVVAAPPTKRPDPRCGQRWRIHTSLAEEYRGCAFLIVDTTEHDGIYEVKFDDGRSMPLLVDELIDCLEFLSGPKGPETTQEAFERVVRLEGETVPGGVGALLNAVEQRRPRDTMSDSLAITLAIGDALCKRKRVDRGRPESRCVPVFEVRRIAAELRQDETARWQKWSKDR